MRIRKFGLAQSALILDTSSVSQNAPSKNIAISATSCNHVRKAQLLSIQLQLTLNWVKAIGDGTRWVVVVVVGRDVPPGIRG